MNRACPDTQDRIADYVLGALDARQAEALREHLAGCSTCRRYLQDLEEQGNALAALGRHVAAGAQARRERAVVTLQGAEPYAGRRFAFVGRHAAMTAAAVVLLAAGITVGRLTAPRPVDVEQLRAEIEASIAGSVRAAMRDDIVAEVSLRVHDDLAANEERARAELVEQVRRDLRLLTAQLAASSQRLVDERFADAVQLIEAGRRTDRDRVAKALEQIAMRTGMGLQTLAARANEPPTAMQN